MPQKLPKRLKTATTTPMPVYVMGGHFELYQDKADQWRWRRVAANGQTLYVSAEGYDELRDAYRCLGASTGIDTPNLQVFRLTKKRKREE